MFYFNKLVNRINCRPTIFLPKSTSMYTGVSRKDNRTRSSTWKGFKTERVGKTTSETSQIIIIENCISAEKKLLRVTNLLSLCSWEKSCLSFLHNRGICQFINQSNTSQIFQGHNDFLCIYVGVCVLGGLLICRNITITRCEGIFSRE